MMQQTRQRLRFLEGRKVSWDFSDKCRDKGRLPKSLRTLLQPLISVYVTKNVLFSDRLLIESRIIESAAYCN